MKEYKIEHGVPIQNRDHEVGVSSTVVKLKVGDSFECEIKNRSSAYSSARYYQIKIAVRKVSDSRIRVWRVK